MPLKYKLSALLTLILILISVIVHKIADYILTNHSSAYNIKNIYLQGFNYPVDPQLDEIFRLTTNEQLNLKRFNKTNLESQLAQHSLIKSAQVQKLYPYSLNIKINERKPIAQIRTLNNTYVVDSEGMILPIVPQDIDIPINVAFGIAIDNKKIADEYLLQMLDSLGKNTNSQIAQININRNREAIFTLQGFEIPFTITNQIITDNHLAKAKKILEFYAQDPTQEKPSIIDVYSDSNVAIGIK